MFVIMLLLEQDIKVKWWIFVKFV